MAKEHKRLGDLLLEEKLITPEQLEKAVVEQRRTGQLLGATLMGLGMVTEEVVVQCLQRQLEKDVPAAPEPVQPVRGVRLGIAALWRSILAKLRPRP